MKKIVCFLILVIIGGCASENNLQWRGDFETGDLSQWSYLLHPQGLSVEEHCVYEGKFAGRARITGSPAMLWRGNESLNRTEFSYKPAAGRVGEGKDTFFGWSFYLEQPLSQHKHEIGYWESEKSYRQMFRFNIHGEDFSFQESAQSSPFWVQKNFASSGVWHDVVMQIHWSTNPDEGFVQIWLDGEDKGKQIFKTLHAAEEAMFTQIGLLRTREDSVETLLIDNVREGGSMRSVMDAFDKEQQRRCVVDYSAANTSPTEAENLPR